MSHPPRLSVCVERPTPRTSTPPPMCEKERTWTASVFVPFVHQHLEQCLAHDSYSVIFSELMKVWK